jgi:hypothetical protein
MDTAYISALAALAGSVVGGFTSGITNWMSYRAPAQSKRLAFDLSRRQDLFRDFIVAASKLYAEALVTSEPPLAEVIDIYAMVSRMRVLCLPRTVACAEKIMIITLDTFYAPNKTLRDVNEVMKSGSGIDPLKEFSEAAREELQSFE